MICFFFYLEFRVVVLVRHSESSFPSFVQSITIFLHSSVQSHWAHFFGSFESFLFFSFGFQSCLSYPFRHLESFLSLVLEFRATVLFGIQYHYHLFLSFGIQSHCTYLFRHLESPLSFLFLIVKVISPQSYHSKSWSLAYIFTGFTHLVFMILHLASLISPRYPVLIAYSSLLVQIPVSPHMTQSFEFTTRTLVMLWCTLHLAFSCSSHRATSFGRNLFYSPEWFD